MFGWDDKGTAKLYSMKESLRIPSVNVMKSHNFFLLYPFVNRLSLRIQSTICLSIFPPFLCPGVSRNLCIPNGGFTSAQCFNFEAQKRWITFLSQCHIISDSSHIDDQILFPTQDLPKSPCTVWMWPFGFSQSVSCLSNPRHSVTSHPLASNSQKSPLVHLFYAPSFPQPQRVRQRLGITEISFPFLPDNVSGSLQVRWRLQLTRFGCQLCIEIHI